MDRRKVQGKKNDGKQIVGFRPGWMSHADVIPGASMYRTFENVTKFQKL